MSNENMDLEKRAELASKLVTSPVFDAEHPSLSGYPHAGPVADQLLKLQQRVAELEERADDLRSGVEDNESRLDRLDDDEDDDVVTRLTIDEISYLKRVLLP